MSGDNYYLLSALPDLDDLGSSPPITPANLLERVKEVGGDTIVLEALLMSDDLLQRQAFLSAEVEEVEPVVLTTSQVRDEEPLPEAVGLPAVEPSSQPPVDVIWESYYRYAASVASKQKSGFLKIWVEFEVGLRNALVTARAKALGLDPQEYLVAQQIGGENDVFNEAISQWLSAPDPLAGLRVLDETRMNWLRQNDGWFTFGDDELIAYGAKLMLLWRWHRLSREVPVHSEKVTMTD